MTDKTSFLNRLNYLKKTQTQKSKKSSAPVRELVLKEWQKIGQYTYRRDYYESIQPPLLKDTGYPLPRAISPADIIFFDTETTGLSGGAGNIVFLLGRGRIQKNRLNIAQFFVADFPGEREFLTIIDKELDEACLYVSYNGSVFDSHLLKSRFILNGMKKSFPRQLDLLFPARRLWKTLIGSCSLNNIEKHVLRIERKQDVPGWEVPDIYFHFLRNGSTERLKLVFAHNYQDIFSLVKLLCLMQSIFANSQVFPLVDKYAVARMLLENGDNRAEELLKQGFSEKNRSCGLLLGLHYKRNGDWQQALEIWQQLYRQEGNLLAGIELAKYWEHRTRDYHKALEIVEELINNKKPLDSRTRAELQHRKQRLQRKI